MINKDLNQIIEKFRSLELAKKHLEKTEIRIQKLHNQLLELNNNLEKEYHDVEKLEKLSLEKLFEKILGNKEKQREKERQEYLQAVLKYNECKQSLELLDFERKVLKEKLAEFNKTKSLLYSLIRKREHSLAKDNPEAKELINEINLKSDQKIARKRELYEAITLAKKLILLIDKTLKDLSEITNWGFYEFNHPDIHLKKSVYLNRAKKKAYLINQLLHQFEDELSDIYPGNDNYGKTNLKVFQNFTKIFFDNLITDWLLLQKIKNTSNSIKNLKNKIIRIDQTLENELLKTDKELETLTRQKQSIIIKYN